MVFNSYNCHSIVFRFIQTNVHSHTQISILAIKRIMDMTEQGTRKNNKKAASFDTEYSNHAC